MQDIVPHALAKLFGGIVAVIFAHFSGDGLKNAEFLGLMVPLIL